MKSCSCGLKFQDIPKDAKYFDDGDKIKGWFWQCSCNSTVFLPVEKKYSFLKEKMTDKIQVA